MASDVEDLTAVILSGQADARPEGGRKSDAISNSTEDPEDHNLEGGTVSGNEVIRTIRRPVLDAKQVSELPQASIDKRYYFVYASRLDKRVTVRWLGKERRNHEKAYRKAVKTIREMN